MGTALGLGGGVVAQAESNKTLVKTMIRIKSVQAELVEALLFPFVDCEVKDGASDKFSADGIL